MQEAVTGEASGVNVERVLAQLNGDAPTEIAEAEAPISAGAALFPQGSTAIVPSAVGQAIAGDHLPVVKLLVAELAASQLPPVESQAEYSPEGGSIELAVPTPQTAFKIETIRVQPQKLDGLIDLLQKSD